MRLPRALLIIFLISGCASIPKAPSVELGVIDYPNGEVIVNMTGNKSLQAIKSVDMATYRAVARAILAGGRVPLASYDRAICFKPTYWQAVQDYMNALVRYLQNHCGN